MTDYNKNDKNYLGEGADAAGHWFHAFHVKDEIHIVYNLGSSEENVIVQAKISKVQNNLESYMWTPFPQFITKIKH